MFSSRYLAQVSHSQLLRVSYTLVLGTLASNMGTPADYLPTELSNKSISELSEQLGLPVSQDVKPLKVTAAYHSIYVL